MAEGREDDKRERISSRGGEEAERTEATSHTRNRPTGGGQLFISATLLSSSFLIPGSRFFIDILPRQGKQRGGEEGGKTGARENKR